MAPYLLLDGQGVVCGYARPGPGVELKPLVGRRVTVEGKVRLLPGGGMPLVAVEKVWGGDPGAGSARRVAATAAEKRRPVRQADYPEAIDTPSVGGSAAQGRGDSGGSSQSSAPYPQPEIIPPGAATGPDEGGSAGCGGPACGVAGGDCPACGPCADGCCLPCGPCAGSFCLPCGWRPSGMWVDVDYLLWWMRGMHVPPLVTSGLTPQQPGILGDANTFILFGDDDIDNRARSGGRLQAGMWLNPCQTVGIEAEYLALATDSTHFYLWSDGNPIVSRPIIDDATGQETVERVAFPRGNTGSVDGAVSVDASTQFQSAALRMRLALCRQDSCWSDPCCPDLAYHDGYRSYLLAGYRYMRLDDRLGIAEQLTSTDTTLGPGAFLIHDQFNTLNQFNGAELGLEFELRRNRWSWDILPKLALGGNHELIDINGFDRTTNPTTGGRTTTQGGLLTVAGSNIGRFGKEEFSVVPSIETKFGFQLTRHTELTLGYTFLYWSNVVRAGDQIDLRTPRTTESTTTGHPVVPYQQTGFWTQGLDFGVAFRW
jgi:hypothetical protein